LKGPKGLKRGRYGKLPMRKPITNLPNLRWHWPSWFFTGASSGPSRGSRHLKFGGYFMLAMRKPQLSNSYNHPPSKCPNHRYLSSELVLPPVKLYSQEQKTSLNLVLQSRGQLYNDPYVSKIYQQMDAIFPKMAVQECSDTCSNHFL